MSSHRNTSLEPNTSTAASHGTEQLRAEATGVDPAEAAIRSKVQLVSFERHLFHTTPTSCIDSVALRSQVTLESGGANFAAVGYYTIDL